jgi:hypothetical protein
MSCRGTNRCSRRSSTRRSGSQPQHAQAPVGHHRIAGRVPALGGNIGPLDEAGRAHSAGERQVGHDLVPLVVDATVDAVGERPTLAVEEDRDVVGRGPQPHRLTEEPLLAGPDPHVVPLRERVVLLLEHEVGWGTLKLLARDRRGRVSVTVGQGEEGPGRRRDAERPRLGPTRGEERLPDVVTRAQKQHVGEVGRPLEFGRLGPHGKGGRQALQDGVPRQVRQIRPGSRGRERRAHGREQLQRELRPRGVLYGNALDGTEDELAALRGHERDRVAVRGQQEQGVDAGRACAYVAEADDPAFHVHGLPGVVDLRHPRLDRQGSRRQAADLVESELQVAVAMLGAELARGFHHAADGDPRRKDHDAGLPDRDHQDRRDRLARLGVRGDCRREADRQLRSRRKLGRCGDGGGKPQEEQGRADR